MTIPATNLTPFQTLKKVEIKNQKKSEHYFTSVLRRIIRGNMNKYFTILKPPLMEVLCVCYNRINKSGIAGGKR